MSNTPNQISAKRPVGRPNKENVEPAVPAVFIGGPLLSMKCPRCGRYGQHKPDKNGFVNAKGEMYYTCGLSACRFAFGIPTVRPL